METVSATQARSNLFDIIKNTLKKHEPFRINHRKGDVVLLSEEDYDSLLETLELLSTPNFKRKYRKAQKEVKQGQTLSFEEIFKK